MQPAVNMLREYPTVDHCVGGVAHFDDAPAWIYELDNPYLHGPYAPTIHELARDGLPVQGELPADLAGAYFRNGPNPLLPPKNRYHPFDGDGMVHGVYFDGGRAAYRNRWVQTEALQGERASGHSVSPGVMGPFDYSVSPFGIKDTSNTDLLYYRDQLVTLWYNAGNPYALHGQSLDTLQPFAVPGRQHRRMSAHSKIDWATGELLFFDYGDEPPYMTYGVADASGRLLHETAVDLPGPRLPHDIGFTQQYVILHDLPFFHNMEVLRQHRLRVLTFHRDMPTRFGIAPRYPDADTAGVRWFECEPCYILHVSNSWEDGDWVIMDGCRSTNPMPSAREGEGELAHMLAYMRLEANNYRWRFNLRTGEVREGDIDDLNTEFNKTNPLFHGVQSRFAYHQRIPLAHEGGHTLRFTGLVKYDNETGRRWQWDYGSGVFGSEAVFAPRAGATRDSARTTATSSPWSRTARTGSPPAWSSTPAISSRVRSRASPCRSEFPTAFTPPGCVARISTRGRDRRCHSAGPRRPGHAGEFHQPRPRRNRRQVVSADPPGGVLGYQSLRRHARRDRRVARGSRQPPALAAAGAMPAPARGWQLSPDAQIHRPARQRDDGDRLGAAPPQHPGTGPAAPRACRLRPGVLAAHGVRHLRRRRARLRSRLSSRSRGQHGPAQQEGAPPLVRVRRAGAQ
jgi:carotenoid cleavage dioxygenase-like enzyme